MYMTTHYNGHIIIQTDTILTAKTLPEGVAAATTDLGVYTSKTLTDYGPRMIDHDAALRLSTGLVNFNGRGEQWNHYADSQQITPNVRVIDECHLYVVFHVYNYPQNTVQTLSVEASATWQKEEVGKKAREEAERKAREEAEKKAKEEEERRAREEEERQAREEERIAREEERRAREEERQARAEEREARAEEREARAEEREEKRPCLEM